MKNLNPLYNLTEGIGTGAAIGGLVGGTLGGVTYAGAEWYAYFLKQLISVIESAKSPLEVKKWFDENIIQNNDVFTRRKFLEPGMDNYGYVDQRSGVMISKQVRNLGKRIYDTIDSVINNKNTNWKPVLLKYCKKELMLYRLRNGFGSAMLPIAGAAVGAAFGGAMSDINSL